MNNNLSFSVIMPTYNQCTFIRRAILSLFQQSYPFWELIIINDGSTDETDLYIKDYLNDKRVTYFN
jgi:glycosyltransferase involved in cell wall biosynthesis